MIGDTIKFTSLFPHKFQITGRTKHFINVFGEEVMVENTDKALALTCSETGALVNEYTVGPIFLSSGKGGHEWFIEFEKVPDKIELFSEFPNSKSHQTNLRSLKTSYRSITKSGRPSGRFAPMHTEFVEILISSCPAAVGKPVELSSPVFPRIF
jgi:hypothetical protein